MSRLKRVNENGVTLSQRIGEPAHAQRFTVNLSWEIANELSAVATRYRVSESSIVEVALRHLLRRIGAPALGAFLRDRGACLRRRSLAP
jgi:hypothetical protein